VLARLVDEEDPTPDLSREDVVIFIAEGILCERLNVPIDEAVVALAGMAVEHDVSLVEVARAIVAGAHQVGPCTPARQPAEGHVADPEVN
jgi:hypothetical protein